jgi:hypothetical protein
MSFIGELRVAWSAKALEPCRTCARCVHSTCLGQVCANVGALARR